MKLSLPWLARLFGCRCETSTAPRNLSQNPQNHWDHLPPPPAEFTNIEDWSSPALPPRANRSPSPALPPRANRSPSPALPPRANRSPSPALPPRANRSPSPALPPRADHLLQQSIHAATNQQYFQELANTLYESFGDHVQVLSEEPSDITLQALTSSQQAYVWLSENHPGQFCYSFPGYESYAITADFEELNSQLLTLFMGSQQETAHLLEAPQAFGSRISDGSHIDAQLTNLDAQLRAKLERKFNIAIHPIYIGGKEIGYRFSSKAGINNTIMFSAHGSGIGMKDKFIKPQHVNFNFVAIDNSILRSETMEFAENLLKGKVQLKDDSQIYDEHILDATNYSLSGGIRTQPEDAAEFIGKMHAEQNGVNFDFVLLNREAKGIHFADLVQGLEDTFGEGSQTNLVCHFCRRKDQNATKFNVSNNYIFG